MVENETKRKIRLAKLLIKYEKAVLSESHLAPGYMVFNDEVYIVYFDKYNGTFAEYTSLHLKFYELSRECIESDNLEKSEQILITTITSENESTD